MRIPQVPGCMGRSGVHGGHGGGAGGAGFVLSGFSAFVLRGDPGCSPDRILQDGEGMGDWEE